MSTAEFQNRVEFLNDTVPLDNSPEEAFDRLTRLSTLILGVPIALVSLVESEREFVKSEASVLDSSPSQGILPLSQSVCQLALGSGEPLVVVDARDHPLLRDDPAVAAYDVRAYAGVPLVTPDGRTLGTFCVMDHVPRQWTTNDVNVLKGLAAAAATEIALRNEIRERVRVQQESARLLQALQAEQGRVMALFEQAPAFIAAVNGPEHRFEMANRAYYQLVGLRDLIGKPLAEAIPETVEQGFVAMLDRVLDTGEAFSAAGARVVLQPRCDAEPDERFVDFACQPLTDPDGTRSGILMHGVDVTEQLRATNALRESEERYRLLFDSNPLPMWVYDAETLRFIAVNCSAVSRYGYSRQEFLAMTILDIRPAAAAEAVRVAAGVAGSGETFVPAQQHRFKDGTIIDVDITSRPIALGARACRLVLAVDVTDRRRAEAALRDSEAQLRLAIDVAEMVVWEHDLATGTVSSRAVPRNPDSSHLLAATLGTHDGFLSVVHQDDRERVRRTHEDAVRRAGEFSVEFRVIGLDGVIRWKQTSARVLLDDDGHPVRIIGVSRDVTDRIALEAQLRQAQKMEAVGQLAGGVAHDFNNLLTVITAGITFAREALPRDAAALEELAVVEEAAGKAARLTRQLLAFGRKQMLQPELLDINRIVRGVEPMLRRLIGEDVRIGTVPVAGLFLVFADPGQLEQVIVNLAVNARDAMPDGGTLTIETASVLLTDVEANARGVDAQARYVRLTVRDTGMGMDDATLSSFRTVFHNQGIRPRDRPRSGDRARDRAAVWWPYSSDECSRRGNRFRN